MRMDSSNNMLPRYLAASVGAPTHTVASLDPNGVGSQDVAESFMVLDCGQDLVHRNRVIIIQVVCQGRNGFTGLRHTCCRLPSRGCSCLCLLTLPRCHDQCQAERGVQQGTLDASKSAQASWTLQTPQGLKGLCN